MKFPSILAAIFGSLAFMTAGFSDGADPQDDAIETAARATEEAARMAEQNPYVEPPPAPCTMPTLTQADRSVLQPATTGERRLLNPKDTGSESGYCVWKVGEIAFGQGRTIGVFRRRFGRSGDDLLFTRDGAVVLGQFHVAPGHIVRIAGRTVILRDQEGESRIPVLADGPPAEAMIDGWKREFEEDFRDRSDVAFARAFREPLGSRRDGCDESRFGYQEAAPFVRTILARQQDFEPNDLDGLACIWKVGDLVAEGGRRYALYVQGTVHGIENSHAAYRLIFLENDETYLGWYYLGPDHQVTIDGADFLYAETPDRVHVGPRGPPAKVWLDGSDREFNR